MIETKAVNVLVAPLFGLAGAVVMLIFRRELETRRMLLALVSGPLFAFLMTPWIVAWLQTQATWFPIDWAVESTAVAVSGTLGCLIGLLALNLIAVVAHAGGRAEVMAETIEPLKQKGE